MREGAWCPLATTVVGHVGAYQPLATLFSVVEVHLQLRVTEPIKFCSQL